MSDNSDISSTADVNPSEVAPPSSAPDTTASPPPEAPADATAPSSSAPDSKAPSSGDSRQSDRDGLLAAVRKVVETEPEKPAIPSDEPGDKDPSSQDQAAATGTGDQPPPDDKPPEPLADPTEAELKQLRPKTRERVEQLIAQRNEARQSFEAVRPELDQHRQLQGYLQQHQLAPEDVNVLLGVGAALRRQDYQGFLNGVTPYVMAAQEALGLRISPDLARQVNEGLIDEDTARELTRTRHRAVQAEARLQDFSQVATANQQVQHVNNIRAAVDTWEANVQRRDPDYAQMSGAVRRFAQGLLQERGVPRSPQEAVALTQAAYDEARAMFVKAAPPPRPTRPSPSSIHVATGTSNAQPRNMKEAVVMALANARRAS